MAFLRIQEFLDARGLTVEELAQLTGIGEDIIRIYTQDSINLNPENTEHLRRIAAKLDVPVGKLIRPVAKQAGVSFKILERAKSQDLDLKELSERSNIHPLLLAIYSSQVLLQNKWKESQTQENINRIATELNTTPEDLIKIEDPPVSQLRINDFLEEKGLSLQELSLLYNVPREPLELLASQPFDFTSFKALKDNSNILIDICCKYLWCCGHERRVN